MKKIYNDRWEIIDSYTEGGQAHIFRVKDKSESNAPYAILKRLKNPSRKDRLQKEIDAYKKLSHKGIPPLLDYCIDEEAFIVIPFYNYPPLSEQSPIEVSNALNIFSTICDIVSYAHSQQVIHRDLKPDNILCGSKDQTIILDFGLCYFIDDNNRLTETMEQVGSRFYIAPEMESGRSENVTSKVDSYALGKILYYMLTGKDIAREAYDNENELSKILKNSQLKYITDKILKRTVVEEPEKRIIVEGIKSELQIIKRLISEHYYPDIEGSVCKFCGEGKYSILNDAGLKVRYRYPPIEKIDKFQFVSCSKCGNVQWFRP